MFDIRWPAGHYALIQAASGCPTGWSSGWRFQDNEDNNNENRWSPSNINWYIRVGLGRNVRTYYCTKTFSGTSEFTWPRGNYCMQGMAAAVQVASMEATYTGMMKTVATLMENKIQFQMGTMIAIPEFIIAAEVMVMLMNWCFFLQSRHLFSTAMVEPVRSCLEWVTLCSFLYILMTKTPAMPVFCSGNHPDGPCNRNHELISAITAPVKRLGKWLPFLTEHYDL